MDNIKEFEIINKSNFLPTELERLTRADLPEYNSVPDSINVQNTQLLEFLKDFRRESTEQLMQLVRNKTVLSPEGILSPEQRKSRYPFWRTEYGQIVFNYGDEIGIVPVQQGEIEKINYSPPAEFKNGIEIHSHPSDLTFSATDIYGFFQSLQQDRSMEQNLKYNSKKSSIKIVSTDNGYWLSFPTKESPAPQGSDLEEDFWKFDNYGTSKRDSELRKGRKLRMARQELLTQLIDQYGESELSSFLGEKMIERKDDPDEINDNGVALIQLYKLLLLTDKYKLGLYYMDKDGSKFKKVTNLEDRFPVLNR